MRLLQFLFSTLSILLCETARSNSYLRNLVQISDGLLQGRDITTYGNQSGIGFLGIPIAKPPTGKLRFHPPVRNDPWEGVLSATHYRNACVSDPVRTYKNDIGGPVDEDCLYLNVFTNKHCLQNGGCAVMAVVHGGKLTMESPVSFPIQPIVNNFVGQDRNIVLVFLPYRLNFFGWLNLSPDVETFVKPTLGIYDIELGFQWIQREIASFGGNPNSVCAFGHSAGGQIVDMVSMSPRFDKLFHSTILMSSNALWQDYNRVINTGISRLTATELGCASPSVQWNDRDQVENVLQCLMTVPWSKILKVHQELVERDIEDYDGIPIDGYFFSKSVHELLPKRKLRPTLLGTVTGEFVITKFIEDKNGKPNPKELKRLCRNHLYGYGYKRTDKMVELCQNFYSSKPFRTKQFFNDVAFFNTAATTGKTLARDGNKVYVYSFSYTGIGDAYVAYQKDMSDRPIHSEEFVYIFGLHRGTFTPKDYEIERIFTGMLANFVNGKNPALDGYEWPEYEETRQQYFNIDFDANLTMPGPKHGYYKESVEFWEMIGKRSGGRRPPTHFPKGTDVFNEMDVIEGQEAHYLYDRDFDDPSVTGSEVIFFRWETFFNTIQLFNKLKFRDAPVATMALDPVMQIEPMGVFPVLMVISLLLLAIAVCYVGCVKYYVFKKTEGRRGYNAV